MPAFVALLRGVNVGGAKRVPMATLRQLLEDLGHHDVVTLLNSGNAVFHATRATPAKLAADISAALLRHLELDVTVIVKSAREFTTIIDECTIHAPEAEHSQLLVAFVQQPKLLATLESIKPLVTAPERFLIGSQAAYLHCASGILESRAGAALLGKAGRAATTRNWATTLKLRTLAGNK
ncbi:MAG TPA: DUF1697 domain-containing protein [Steroidobacteraceae bacterium]|nr:DUF1697 domain-containing protein [Steroidobacteraceae bacterium]